MEHETVNYYKVAL